jgi:predicted GTPase
MQLGDEGMMSTGADDLGDAIAAVVRATRARAEAVLAILDDAAAMLKKPAGSSDAEWQADAVAWQVAEGISGIARRRRDHQDRFNIVVFGRTGVGKSTLIEAFAGGDGRRISAGKINNTTTASSVPWRDCVLWDAPGVDGQDGQADTQALDLEAERMVEAADVVLLCFDTTSAEASVFEKAAGWVAAFGKPAIAVLNVRSPAWRYPPHAYYRRMHARLCETNEEHASRIREELAAIGMAGVPVIAMHSPDAAFARATLPWRGPAPADLERRRAGARGTARLLSWSNLPALWQLLAAMLSGEGAATLRMRSLVRQADGALDAGAGLLAGAEMTYRGHAEQAERGIERLLALLGPPEFAGRNSARSRQVVKWLAELERRRGGRFAAPAGGQAMQYAQSQITTEFAPLRAAAHVRADTVVDVAMTTKKSVDPEEFAAKVYRDSEMKHAAAQVRKRVIAYLEQRVSDTLVDIARDLAAVTAELKRARVAGAAGKGWYRTSWAAKTLGAAAFIGTGLVALFTPAGPLVIIGALINAGTTILGWFSGRRATRLREAALAIARTEARQAVDEPFDRVEQEVAAAAREIIAHTFESQVGLVAEQAVAFRRAADSLAERRQYLAGAGTRLRLAETGTGLPAESDAKGLLQEAIRWCEQQVAAATPGLDRQHASGYLWMGETFRADPTLVNPDGEPAQGKGRRARRGASRPSGLGDWVRAAIAGPFAVPRARSGQGWLDEARRRLAGDASAATMLAELTEMAAAKAPRVVVAGGYSAGKSSFIRRLLIEAGQQPPAGLRVGGHVTTREVADYGWHGLALVDVPGFQSGDARHEAAAFAEARDAAAVIYLLGRQLSGLDDIVRVLAGEPDGTSVAKSGRTIIVLNRSDQFILDPAMAPERHEQACQAKREEAAAAINARAAELRRAVGTIKPDQILCTASRPYDEPGETPAHFDPYRSWDGFADLQQVLLSLRAQLIRNGTDVSILHGGIGRLQGLIARGRQEAQALHAQATQLRALRGDQADALNDGSAIRRAQVNRLARKVGDYLEAELNKALQADDAHLRRLTMEKLASWPSSKGVSDITNAWLHESARVIAEWETRTGLAVDRRLESRAFQGALGHDLGSVPLGFLRRGTRTGAKAAAEVSERVGAAFKAADEPTVALLASWAGKAMLADESIMTIARWATRIGATLQIAGGVAQVAVLIMDYRDGLDSDAQLLAAGRRLREQAAQWAELVALGGDDGPGLLTGLTVQCAELEQAVAAHDRRTAQLEGKIAALAARKIVYQQLISEAEDRLRINREQEEI